MSLRAGGRFDPGGFFEPIEVSTKAAFVAEAEAIERAAQIENHGFFPFAKRTPQALVLWASQELIVTNPFSQILARVFAQIDNVHVRSLLLPVLIGEHSGVRQGVAANSHPWLIWKLCRSLGLDKADIRTSKAVAAFIAALEEASDDLMYALGALGIGNELMLLAEYRAVESCFDACFPNAEYRDFLHANIAEDEGHTNLIGLGATALEKQGLSAERFLNGARAGVAARVQYYDALLAEAQG